MPNAPGRASTAGSHVTVAYAMSAKPLVLPDDMRVDAAATLLVEHGYTGAPTVDGQGRLSGVLHALDVAAVHLPPVVDVHDERKARGVRVRDLVRPAVTISPACPVGEAAQRMRMRTSDRLVVIDDARIVGVVTAQDLLWIVVLQGDLLRAAVDERITALGVTTVSADVDTTGVVLLHGRVASPSARDLLLRAIGGISGVTEVEGLITIASEPDAARRRAPP